MAEYVIIFLVLAFVAHEFYAMKKDEEKRKNDHSSKKRLESEFGTGTHSCYTPPPIGGRCPWCGHPIKWDHGRYGKYVRCTNRSCRYTHW